MLASLALNLVYAGVTYLDYDQHKRVKLSCSSPTRIYSSYISLPWYLSSIWHLMGLVIKCILLAVGTVKCMTLFDPLEVVFNLRICNCPWEWHWEGMCYGNCLSCLLQLNCFAWGHPAYYELPDLWGIQDNFFLSVFQKEAWCFKTIEIDRPHHKEGHKPFPNASNKGKDIIMEKLTVLCLKDHFQKDKWSFASAHLSCQTYWVAAQWWKLKAK